MRQVRVPRPLAAWEVSCEGPFSSSTASPGAARSRLAAALRATPRLDLALGDEGWTVVWGSSVLEAGSLVRRWLWVARTGDGPDLSRALGTELDAAGFRARTAPRRESVDRVLEPRVLYLRSGGVRLDLETSDGNRRACVDVVEEDRDGVDFGLTFRFGPQRCPGCDAEEAPAALVAGFPSADLLLAAELGEVAFADGGLIDRRSRNNARCRRCGADFRAR